MATNEEISLSKLQDIWKPGFSSNNEGDISDIASGTSGEIAILWQNSQKLSKFYIYILNERGNYVLRTSATINRKSTEIVAFMGSNIVVSYDLYLKLYDTDFSRCLYKSELQKNSSCMFAHRNSLFVTSVDSSKVMVYSPELVKESEICLNDIDDQQYPVDLAVTESFIYICTASSGKAMSFEKTTGNKQFTFEPTQEHISFAISITVNATADLVLVLFKTNQILLFPLTTPRCLVAVDFAAIKIMALQKNQLVAVDQSGVHSFEMVSATIQALLAEIGHVEIEKRTLETEQSQRHEVFTKMLQTVKIHINVLNESIEELTYLKRTFIGDNQNYSGLSTTDPKEDRPRYWLKNETGSSTTDPEARDKSVETIRRENYHTITSQDSGISIPSKSSGQDETVKEEPSNRSNTRHLLSTGLLQTIKIHIDALHESIENFTYRKKTFIGDNQNDTGLSTTDTEEDRPSSNLFYSLKNDTGLSTTDTEENSKIAAATATDGEAIRRGKYNTIASKESGISSLLKSSGEDETVKEDPGKRYSDTIHYFLAEDKFSASVYTGNYFNLVVAATIGTEGGELEIPGTKCSINIPPNALKQEEDITIRIVPQETWLEKSKSFASNSSSIIELLPNNLKLVEPAHVKIPHCLQISKRSKAKVKIYISHHEENCPPHWEKSTEHKYKLENDVFTVYTSSFCWIKVEIDDQIVEAKKIQVFATVPTITPEDSTSVFTIGYCLDLPGLRMEKEAIEKKCFLFKKDKYQSLTIALKKTVPKFWNNQPPSSPQEIPFSDIELSKDSFRKFPLLKSSNCRGIPLCMFTVSQGKREITLSVRPPISSS